MSEHPLVSRRVLLWCVAGFVAVNAVLLLIDALVPSPSGKPSSSLATAPRGFAAWAELAERNGIEVIAFRESLGSAELPRGGTVVALDVPALEVSEARALRAHAAAGGRVVVGGREPQRWLDVFDRGLRWSESGPREATTGGRRLAGAGRGGWSPGGLVVRRPNVVLLADASPLQNARLARADNAAFALDLAGPGPLVFAESAHGYGTARGLAALPGAAKGALAILLVAALLLLLARGRRFGPVEPGARPLPPPRAAYVDALGAALERTKDPAGALEPLRAAAGGDPPTTEAEAYALARRHSEMMHR